MARWRSHADLEGRHDRLVRTSAAHALDRGRRRVRDFSPPGGVSGPRGWPRLQAGKASLPPNEAPPTPPGSPIYALRFPLPQHPALSAQLLRPPTLDLSPGWKHWATACLSVVLSSAPPAPFSMVFRLFDAERNLVVAWLNHAMPDQLDAVII